MDKRIVVAIDRNGSKRSFESVTEAAETIGCSRASVYKGISTEKMVFGRLWRYEYIRLEQSDAPEGKRCPKCGYVKSFDDFGKNASRSDGLQNWCRECKNEALRTYRNGPASICPACGARTINSESGFCRKCDSDLGVI